MNTIKTAAGILLSAALLLSASGCSAKTPAVSAAPAATPAPSAAVAPAPTPTPIPTPTPKTVVLDPGHQAKADTGTEPVGPGASRMKQKVSSGTQGKATGVPEYELNLAVSLKLRAVLESRGYRVIMTRTENAVSLSNAQRAQIANDAGADAFVRIHANGSGDPSASGVLTLCMTARNPYNAGLYGSSRRLSEDILKGLAAGTGARSLGVTETDDMTGINWSQAPVTIVEMGFMTNRQEDILMETDDYQAKIAAGIADGIDLYFKGEE